MKYQLVVQWAAASLGDYDRMIAIETRIIDGLGNDAEVDGHDAGSGEVNIFVHTDLPGRTFERIRSILASESALVGARVAYREMTADDYTVLWPNGVTTFTVA